MKRINKIGWGILGGIYLPVYMLFWILHKIARFLLAISYYGMIDTWLYGRDILRHLFKFRGGRYGQH